MKRAFAGLLLAASLVIGSSNVSAIMPFQLIELGGQNVKWGFAVLGTPATVTVGFVDRVMTTPNARNCSAMRPLSGIMQSTKVSGARFRAEVRAALNSWERVAGIRFQLVEDASRADILIGEQVRPRGRAFANVMHEEGDNADIGALTRSFVCLNPTQKWKVGFDGRMEVYDLRYTIAHEIGHAIGLNHPGPEGQLMSFRYSEGFRGPQSGDKAGAMVLYGPPPRTYLMGLKSH